MSSEYLVTAILPATIIGFNSAGGILAVRPGARWWSEWSRDLEEILSRAGGEPPPPPLITSSTISQEVETRHHCLLNICI